jgi:hypothetical protein
MPRLVLGPFTKPPLTRDALPAAATRFLPIGANLVETDPLRMLFLAAPSTLEDRRIVLVDGAPGGGKSTALAVLAAGFTAPMIKVVVYPQTTGMRFMEAVSEAITGTRTKATQRDHEDHLRRLLAETPRILAIDEVQNATINVLRSLRLIMEEPDAKFALVLCGSGVVTSVQRDPMISSWVGLTVKFDRIGTDDLRHQLDQLHPGFAAVPLSVLDAADAAYAHGGMRNWIVLLEKLLHHAKGKPFTRQMFSDALTTMTNVRPKKI